MICCWPPMQKPLKTILVDDETRARRSLRRRLEEAPELQIVAEARDGHEALELIRRHRPELMFLDVQMPGMDGFDVLRALKARELPVIIFITMSDDFAIRAFETHALDYLLKPIGDAALRDALVRARRNRDKRHAADHRKRLLGLVRDITGRAPRLPGAAKNRGTGARRSVMSPRLAIRDGGRTTWVRQQDIEWIDAAGDYMCVHAGGETHIMRMTMKRLEQALNPSILQRIHRSTIVNIKQVKALEPHMNGEYFLTLASGHKVKLSRSYKDKLAYFA
jgi:two-component system LytT family response regulator